MSVQPDLFTSVGVSPFFPAFVPVLTSLQLSDDESRLVSQLYQVVQSRRYDLELLDAYYNGTNRIADLGISIPPQLRNLRTVIGWPKVAVDAVEERIQLNGFRYPDSDDMDEDLQSIFDANDMLSESSLAHIDAAVFGRSYVAVGSGNFGPGSGPNVPPLITVESPLDMAVVWDPRSRAAVYALRAYGPEGQREATLYTQVETVWLVQGAGGWQVLDRDQHNLGVCPVTMITNRSRSYNREGTSDITPAIMSITDRACRTLMGSEVAREFFAAPQRYILGADETAFQDAEGNPKSAWTTYMGRVLALENDAQGNKPEVGSFATGSPEGFMRLLDKDAQFMSTETGLPPHMLGVTSDNPASADAIRASELRMTRIADRKCASYGTSWRNVAKLALLVRDGELPPNAMQIVPVWADTATPTPAETSDAIFKQVQMGYLPATSDVTGEKLGYTPAERARIEADRDADAGASFLLEIQNSLTATAAKKDTSLEADLGKPVPEPSPDDGPAPTG